MKNKEFTVKTMSRKEVDIAIEWAAGEGWNPGLHDADCYYNADPNSFLIGRLGDEPIAAVSVSRYGELFGFLSFYIVKPVYRGRGYGIQIWNAGLKYLEGRKIGLDAVFAQQENYSRSGFNAAYNILRYKCKGGGSIPENVKIVKLSTLDFETIAAYDRPFFPADRSHFIRCWIEQPEGAALGIMQHGRLAGYGVIRACRKGYKAGPLIADSRDLAESLFSALRSMISPYETIYLDVPETNPNALSMADQNGMKAVFETTRMYTGKIPELPHYRLFGEL